jgi:D-alanyl-D-alanine carboxypeptidase (penicillin-binding protein 5/6)
MRILRLLLILLVLALPAAAFETKARSAILIDYRTGQVLFAKDPDMPLPPASMSKLMTAYLAFEALREGRLKLDDMLLVSERAWKMGGSQMFLEVNKRAAVSDLLRGMIIQSGNDACVVLAETLAGSEEAFAQRMNEKARELGLTNSQFANSTGLDAPNHLMSARDLAILARRIISDFPDFYPIYSEKEFTFNEIRQPNRNPLLQSGVPGVDGIKTGYTAGAGYGLVTSALRGQRRLILVVTGLGTLRERSAEAERLLEYGFREFEEYRIYEAGQPVRDVPVWLGQEDAVTLIPQETVAVTLPRNARESMVAKVTFENPVPAPVVEGQPAGQVEVTAPGIEPLVVPLVAASSVPEAGPWRRLKGMVAYMIWGAPS